MKLLAETGREDIAKIFIAENESGKLIEFVHSIQPPLPRDKKWVFTISTLFGCPVGCSFCDAGAWYEGKLSTEEMMYQIDFMVNSIYPDKAIPSEKFKIQFARTGEPSFNDAVLDVLEELPNRFDAPGLMPSLSTIGPKNRDKFFERLLEIKRKHYGHRFQLQFSIHTTDTIARDKLLPVPKWSFEQISQYGKRFFEKGDRKITLNFALAQDSIIDPSIILAHFDPKIYLIKMTPVNPTGKALENNIISGFERANDLGEEFSNLGYDVAKSFGEQEENQIGSNCGQYIASFRKMEADIKSKLKNTSYSYELHKL